MRWAETGQPVETRVESPLAQHRLHYPARTDEGNDVLIRLVAKGADGGEHVKILQAMNEADVEHKFVTPLLRLIHHKEGMTFAVFPLIHADDLLVWSYNVGEAIEYLRQVFEVSDTLGRAFKMLRLTRGALRISVSSTAYVLLTAISATARSSSTSAEDELSCPLRTVDMQESRTTSENGVISSLFDTSSTTSSSLSSLMRNRTPPLASCKASLPLAGETALSNISRSSLPKPCERSLTALSRPTSIYQVAYCSAEIFLVSCERIACALSVRLIVQVP